MPTVENHNDGIRPLGEIDRTVHEPARLMILAVLHGIESADFLFLLRQTGLSKGNLSAHVRKLETAGYIAVEKEFVDRIPRTLLHMTEEGRRALENYRDGMLRTLNELH